MSQPVLECVNPWLDECVCGASHLPCWPRPDVLCCDRINPEGKTPEQLAQIELTLHAATEIIWRLSGKQFGSCPVTVRPCRQSCSGGNTGYWSDIGWMPVLQGGVWFNTRCDRCKPSGCSCSELCEIDLPGPVAEVLQVKLDGEVLDPAEYRVDNARKLVRTSAVVSLPGESGCWPTCQDMALPSTEPGTFEVTYRRGQAVPYGALRAVGLLACELQKACDPDGEQCALPKNAQRIARQGVTVEMVPVLVRPGEFATGIPEVDLWLQSVNPYKSALPSRVFSVDRPAPRTTTWPCSG